MTSPATPQPATAKMKNPETLLILGSLLSGLAILSIVAWLLIRERADVTLAASSNASNIVKLINADVMRSAELYDSTLLGMIKVRERPDVVSLAPELQQYVYFDRSTAAPYKGDLVLLDPQGEILVDSLSVVPRVDNFSDRSYFQYHRDNPSSDLHISTPYKTRWGYKDWCIGFSRRVSGPNGEFLGIASAAMRLVYFKQLFMGQMLGKDSAINLIHTDGVLVVRYPESVGQDLTGRDYAQTPNFQRIIREGAGSFTAYSNQYQTDRLYTFSRVGGLPLVIVMGQASDEVYAVWRRNAWLVGGATGALCLGILWLTLLLCRELRLRHQAQAELANLAATDGLTGLPNRRRLDQAMGVEWARARRGAKPLSLLMIDVDHFKAFNKHHGHAGGDEALKAVARTLSEALHRPADLAARYGGEEFVVVLPETGLSEALDIAETLRRKIADIALFGGVCKPLTVSIGVACAWVKPGDKLEAFFGQADKALYRAKGNGRNRVETEADPGQGKAMSGTT